VILHPESPLGYEPINTLPRRAEAGVSVAPEHTSRSPPSRLIVETPRATLTNTCVRWSAFVGLTKPLVDIKFPPVRSFLSSWEALDRAMSGIKLNPPACGWVPVVRSSKPRHDEGSACSPD
jgi:hypothetical protein